MNLQNIRSQYEVSILKSEIDRILNSERQSRAGGACFLTRYEIIVGKLHIYKKKRRYILLQSKNYNL